MGCGSSKPKSLYKQVVIVGGGYSGSYLAYLLQKFSLCEIILIDPKDCMHYFFAVPRCIVEPEFLKHSFIPFEDFVKKFVKGTVTSINAKKKLVLVNGARKIPYDYLVIATGSSSSFPIKLNKTCHGASKEDATNLYKAFTEEMKRAPDIILAGGNLLNIEIAGEIRADYPDKKVSLLCNENEKLICSSLPKELDEELRKLLYKKDIDLVSESEITNFESLVSNKFTNGQHLEKTNGKKIEADLVINCNEPEPSKDFCKEALGEALLESGKIKVDSFKARGCENIYSLGEATDVEEVLTPYNIQRQAEYLASRIQAEISNEEFTGSYQSSEFALLIAFGRYDGVGYENGNLLDEDDVMEKKSATFNVDIIWSSLGLHPPEL
ncbi:ferroptosis suppressor protein 1-like [Clavelina lepadiformis]|uniref:Ferroptosis suppressor protein 1 n=1 Tax=Clavelina lepadiformis TaxID=159417 RepID=A0ABP0GKH1_CLALP